MIEIIYPLDTELSKNRSKAFSSGHYYIPSSHRKACENLITGLKVANRGQKWVSDKVWIEIFIRKSKRKLDVANFIDAVSDCVSKVILIDDCYFSIKADWKMCKKGEEEMFIRIKQ